MKQETPLFVAYEYFTAWRNFCFFQTVKYCQIQIFDTVRASPQWPLHLSQTEEPALAIAVAKHGQTLGSFGIIRTAADVFSITSLRRTQLPRLTAPAAWTWILFPDWSMGSFLYLEPPVFAPCWLNVRGRGPKWNERAVRGSFCFSIKLFTDSWTLSWLKLMVS